MPASARPGTILSQTIRLRPPAPLARALTSRAYLLLGLLCLSQAAPVVTVGTAQDPDIFLLRPMNGSVENSTAVEFRWTSLDPDGDPLAFVLELSDGVGFNITRRTGEKNLTLELLDRTGYAWRITASDGVNNVSSAHSNFTVRVNRPQVIHSVPVLEARPGYAYVYQVVATDPDPDALRFHLVEGPAGMGMFPDGKVLWVPSAEQAEGSFRVAITVGDGELEERQEFTIKVGKAPPQAPSDASGPPLWVAAVLALVLAVEIAVVWILRKGRRGSG